MRITNIFLNLNLILSIMIMMFSVTSYSNQAAIQVVKKHTSNKVRLFGEIEKQYKDGSAEILWTHYLNPKDNRIYPLTTYSSDQQSSSNLNIKHRELLTRDQFVQEIDHVTNGRSLLRKGTRIVWKTPDQTIFSRVSTLYEDKSSKIMQDGRDLPIYCTHPYDVIYEEVKDQKDINPLENDPPQNKPDNTHHLSGADTSSKSIDKEISSQPVFDFPYELFEPLRRALIKKQVGSFIITGESGSGKTEFVRSFIYKIKNGEFAEIPKNTKIIEINATELQSNTSHRGEFEAKVQKLIEEATKSNNTILLIDEIHTLRGAGAHSQSSNDFFNMIKPYLSNGLIRIIGITTNNEYEAAFSGDEALRRRMPEIKYTPNNDAPSVIEKLKTWSAKFKLIPFSDELLNKIVNLANEFDAVSTLLVKAIRLQEELYATAVLNERDPATFTLEDLYDCASRIYGIDKSEFNENSRISKMQNFIQTLNEKIIGLENIKKELIDETNRILIGTHDNKKPRIRFILTGPKGLGKTHIAKSYAEAMNLPFERIMMSRYKTYGSIDELISKIASLLMKHPFTVILFDEIEKCSSEIQESLLDLMDSEYITAKKKIKW